MYRDGSQGIQGRYLDRYASSQAPELQVKYAIYDWAGNHLSAHGKFETFQDAWDYILGEMTDKLGLSEEDYQEYQVLEV
jgi:hypothetical protein